MTPILTEPAGRREFLASHLGVDAPPDKARGPSRFVVVHGGARDAYQLARALSDADMLEVLVTDLFWPADRRWAESLRRVLPTSLHSLLLQRSERELPFSRIHLCAAVGLATLICDKMAKVPKSIRRRVTRYADATLGRTAGTLASHRGSNLVSYSYYGFDAIGKYGKPAMLFQMHPHPSSMRRILTEELEAHPDCAESLKQEWELSLPEEDFEHLVKESGMASSYLVASSFTKQTLVENGVSAQSVTVVPYGVDTRRFIPDDRRDANPGTKLQLLFVGRINQRKGIKYLLEALRLLKSDRVHLTVCGRVVDGLELFRPFADRVSIRPSVGARELVAAYQAADLFVFPSVAEGFGQVLLESLACGLPVLSTTRTAAPDLIENGLEGFVVEPRSAAAIAERIAWAIDHRSQLAEMSRAARLRAEQFTWHRFRTGVVAAAKAFAYGAHASTQSRSAHV